jgi:hypothetical protein
MNIVLRIIIITAATILMSCAEKTKPTFSKQVGIPIEGTWRLITGTTIEKGTATVIHYTKNQSFIKIINDTHFAFLQHDLSKGKDSVASFSSGGGSYTLKDSLYTEHLEYCSAREWEGNDFSFTVSIKSDTLIQSGIEKIEAEGVNRINIEKYVRLKSQIKN